MRKRKTTRSILCLFLSLMMIITTFSPVFADAVVPVVPEPEATVPAPELPPAETPVQATTESIIPTTTEVTTPSEVPLVVTQKLPVTEADGTSFYKFGAIEKALEENAQFMPNIGQMDDSVAWYGNFGAGTVFVQKDGTLTYLLLENDKEDNSGVTSDITAADGSLIPKDPSKDLKKGWVLKEQFVGAGGKATVSGKNQGKGKFNFLLGNDKKTHKTDVEGYQDLTVTKLYPKIDLLLSHKGETIEKTFQLDSGADPSAIKIKMDGTQKLSVDSKGNLVVGTDLGNILFSAPKAWQDKKGKEPVEVKYWTDGIQYGFTLGAYDNKEPLYIDPEIVSTYFGGMATYTNVRDTAVDAAGNVYAVGDTYSASFPTTAGAYDVSYNSLKDGFVTKLNSDLSQILASTVLGGSGNNYDYGRQILITPEGTVYVALETDAATFPTAGTPYDSTYNGGYSDIVIACLDSNLSTLEHSTFIGGSGSEYVNEMIQNKNGEIVFAGVSYGDITNYPTTAGSYQRTPKGIDAFVSILSADLSTLVASTFIGANYSSDEIHAMTISPAGDIYVTGFTQSYSFPVTAGAYDTTFNTGMTDVFVSRFNGTLTTLKSSTYLGGSNGNTFEQGDGIALLPDGSVAVTGRTTAANFPVTAQAFDASQNGDYDGFISVLSYDLGTLKASTFIGGTAADYLTDLKADAAGTLYAVGSTFSDGFPVTADALDSTRSAEDGVIVKIDSNLTALKYSTFLGGSAADRALGFTLTDEGTLFIYGFTNSTNFPVTTGALQTTNVTWLSFILKTPRDLTGLAAADWVRMEGIQQPGLDPGYGGYTFDQSVLKVTGARPLDFRIGYNSILLKEGPVGQGWNHNFEAKLIKADSGNVEIDWNQNRISRFTLLGNGTYQPAIRYNPYEHLTKEANGSYTLIDRSAETYSFTSAGQLTQQKNKTGQVLTMGYDANGRLQTVTEAISGRALTLAYNANGLLASVTDPLSRQATFVYDGTNRLITYTDAAGKATHYTYNTVGQILTITNNDGKTLLANTYDAPGRVVEIDDNLADGKKITVSYNQSANASTVTSTITDRNGKVTVGVYDSFHELKKATDALNKTTDFTYDNSGNITSATDAKGHITNFTWDAEGNMLHDFDAQGHETTFTYDAQHNILSSKNALNKTAAFTYDANNNLTGYQDRLNNLVTYTYNSGSQLTGVTKPRGGVTALTNQSGQAVSITPSGGSAATLAYDGAGRLTSATNGAGKTTSYTYDAMDQLLSVTDPLNHSSSYTYDCDGNRLTATDPRNNTTHYTYDENNRLTQVTDALNHSTSFAYDAEGWMVSKTDALNHTTQYGYDENGRLITETDPLNHVKTNGYDEVGNLTGQKDALNNAVFTGTYDAVGNLVTAKDALNHTTQNTYDLLNRLTSVEDPLTRVTGFGYDDLDRLIQGTDAQNGQSSIGYDADGNRNTITDQNTQQTGFAFDLAGRLATITSAAGYTKAYQYNTRELVSQITNGRLQAANITYDDSSRSTSITDPAGPISYTYDNAGNILTVSDSNGTLTRQYDALGRITQYTDGNNNTIGYSYDGAGRLTTLTYPGGRQVTYGYDAANRLTTVTDWSSKQTQYGYDANNRLTTITRPDGTNQTNTYDAKGQLTVAEDRDSQNNLVSRYEYTYDSVGNITTETSTTGQGHVEINTFSAVDRITAQTVTENGIPTEQYGYTYDAGGNILTATNSGVTTTFTNGNANRIATVNGQTAAYDADGNITNAPLNGTPATFSFDARNRLTSVGNTSYTYNPENQRIGITENGVATSYVINPNAALSQTLIKTTGGVSTYYVYGLGLIAEQTGDDYKTYHYDLRGSTVALTDSTGLVTDTFSYAPYGELLSRTGTSDVDYLYNGRDGVITDNNGLYQMRARYYDPELRRFLNEDEYAGKYDDILNVNLYAYCEGSPVGFVDPSGNNPVLVVLVAVAAYLGETAVETVPDVAIDAALDGNNFDLGKSVAINYGTNLIPVLGEGYTAGKISTKVIKKVPPSAVINALSKFKSVTMSYGGNSFLLDKSGMKHILERHHPKYWDGSIKTQQTFFDKNMSIDKVTATIQEIMRQNKDVLIKRGTKGMYQIRGTVNGIEYVLGINKGRISQLYKE